MSGAKTTLVDVSNVAPEALALLNECGAMQRPHSGRTLFHHLAGTYGLLRSWGNSESVCLGGLFHSIYGTNAFKHQSLPSNQRLLLQSLIGEDAEALAWQFCHINRPWDIIAALEGQSPVLPGTDQTNPDWIALAEIEAANLLEQGDIGRALRELYCSALDRPGTVSPAACAALKSTLTRQLTQHQASQSAIDSLSAGFRLGGTA